MISIKVNPTRVYDVELFGQIHRMEEPEYISFLENLDKLPRPENMYSVPMLDTRQWLERLWNQLQVKDMAKAAVKLEEWKQSVIMDDEPYTPGELKEDKDVKVYVQPAPEPEAVEEEKTEPKEIQPVAAIEPEVQEDSNTEAVEPEKREPRKWKKEDFDKYIAMAIDGVRPKEIIKTMVVELEIKPANAQQLFYNKIKPVVPMKIEAEPEPIPILAPAIVAKIEPIAPEPTVGHKPTVKMHLVDGELQEIKATGWGKSVAEIAKMYHVHTTAVEEIALMPVYDSARTFKDAVVVRDDMNTKYTTEALKQVYRATHIGTRW
ncbi:MAG: hypothetical protein K0M69_15815 [Youngiibacter sp.]|nr:hypothetical protein [Youngiibacter sp.]